MYQVLSDKANKLNKISDSCAEIQIKKTANNVQTIDDLLDSMPIENIRDLSEFTNGRGYSKAKFKDLLEYNKLKKEGEEIVEIKQLLLSRVRMNHIELLQAQIDVLLKREG